MPISDDTTADVEDVTAMPPMTASKRRPPKMVVKEQAGMYTGDDRTRQVDSLRALAGDIRDGMVGEGTPEEQVEYYLSQEEMPSWFDDHDRKLLIDMVKGERLAKQPPRRPRRVEPGTLSRAAKLIKAEEAYLAAAVRGNQVSGLGTGAGSSTVFREPDEISDDEMAEAFSQFPGMTEEKARAAARGRRRD